MPHATDSCRLQPAADLTVQRMTDYTTPAEHTFLTPAEVFDRYRWKRTTGYEQLRSAGFPARIAGGYRLRTRGSCLGSGRASQ